MIRIVLFSFFVLCLQFSFAQKISLNDFEKLVMANSKQADTILKKLNFSLTENEKGADYNNYYYTSYDKVDSSVIILRTISFMDLYHDNDTARLLLYRTYYKNDQEEMKKQLLSSGYELTKRTGNNYIYKKGDITITNKISEKMLNNGKPVTAYEFETGR